MPRCGGGERHLPQCGVELEEVGKMSLECCVELTAQKELTRGRASQNTGGTVQDPNQHCHHTLTE
jgi:hypothetical protein